MTQSRAFFEKAFSKIQQSKFVTYSDPAYAIESYQQDKWFAKMEDSGYIRQFGKLDYHGIAKWVVVDEYPNELRFHGITEQEFIAAITSYCNT